MIELRTLGGVELRGSDGSDFGSLSAHRGAVALLAYLAIQGRRGFLSRDQLVALLWSGTDREQARVSLQSAIEQLQRGLGQEVIVAAGTERLVANPEVLWCDAVEFEAAIESDLPDAALTLYRGDLLRGFSIEDAPGFQRWLDAERVRFRAEADRAERNLAKRTPTLPAPAALEEDDLPSVANAPVIPGYVIERTLGRGAAAVVYLAREVRHNRKVAVKVLKPEFAGSVQERRFAREIELVAEFSHPHIVPLLTSGRVGDACYYITPYVAGESLRQRLDREQQLEISEAVRIACEVAEGLDYAHRLGVVHRDVKPENILLADGHAQIADFGLALAVSGSGSGKLTDSGIGVGTPHYVSPEQAAAGSKVDRRADIYSLGCVLYELIAGSPPFTGVSVQQIIAQHMTAPVPSLRLRRPGISIDLERAVMKALAKTPADRFRTASAFAEMCGRTTPPSRFIETMRFATDLVRSQRTAGIGVVLLVSAGTVWAVSNDETGGKGGDKAPGVETIPAASAFGPDVSRYAVIPVSSGKLGVAVDEASQLLYAAIRRWSGITVIDPREVRDAVAQLPRGAAAAHDAQRVAGSLNAGRYVRLTASQTADSLDVHATLIDTRNNSMLTDATARVSADLNRAASTMAVLADSLLFPERVRHARLESRVGTRSLPARQAYLRGHRHIEQWDLAAADSEFVTAVRIDPEYAQASLWLAQVRRWQDEPTTRWRFAAEQADAGRERLAARDQLLVSALLALSRGEVDRACPIWSRLTRLDSTDFAAWYGLGNCLTSDNVVVPDPVSSARWRFRTSYDAGLKAYRRAFQLLPSTHRSFQGSSLARVRALLMTSTDAVRYGRAAPPDTTRFGAYPLWSGDSLAFVPVPLQQFADGNAIGSEAVNVAVRHQRELFHEIATMWRAAFPSSADAVEAVAIGLDMLGNAAALDTLGVARRLAADRGDHLRIGAFEVWMRVKFALPDDIRGLRAAVALADSLVAIHRPLNSQEASILASLAALLGRASLAAAHARMAEAHNAPAAIAHDAPALLAFAALGGPRDSLRLIEGRVSRGLRNQPDRSRKAPFEAEWLLRPALLALPDYRFESISRLAKAQSMRGRLLAALQSGNLSAASQQLAALREARQRSAIRASDITTDGLYPEAAILAALGDASGAIAWLDPTLDSLAFADPQNLAHVARAGALVRAMVLRAFLAELVGDRRRARIWGRAVATVWAKPDPFLKPTLARVQYLAR